MGYLTWGKEGRVVISSLISQLILRVRRRVQYATIIIKVDLAGVLTISNLPKIRTRHRMELRAMAADLEIYRVSSNTTWLSKSILKAKIWQVAMDTSNSSRPRWQIMRWAVLIMFIRRRSVSFKMKKICETWDLKRANSEMKILPANPWLIPSRTSKSHLAPPETIPAFPQMAAPLRQTSAVAPRFSKTATKNKTLQNHQ